MFKSADNTAVGKICNDFCSFIANIDINGNTKNIFVSPNMYNTVSEAEEGLQIGAKNPLGPTSSPAYKVEFNMNSVRYNYAGNVEGGSGIEMTTNQPIPVNSDLIIPLK